MLPGALKSRCRSLVLLRIEILLTARQGRGFAELEAGIDAPQAGQGRSQGGADQEAGAARALQEIGIDVGRVDEEMRPVIVGHLRRGQLAQIVGDLALGVAPGEVGVGLREADLGEAIHHGRPREGLGQEDHIGMPAADIGDHPFPEGQRLGVRIVDAEDPHAFAGPVQHDIAQRQPQLGHRAFGVEVDIDDVFVLLGRILGVADRAVGATAKPFGMLAEPGMVGRALDGEIERDLEAMLAGSRHQPAEVLRRAQRGMDRIVAAVAGADGVGAAGIVGRGLQGIVAALAIGRADRMDGREVKDVEPHVANTRQVGNDVVEGPQRAREELVPARELRLRPLDLDGDLGMPAGQMTNLCRGDQMVRFGSCQQTDSGLRVGTIQLGDELAKAQPAQVGGGIGDVDGDIDTGAALDLESVAQAAVLIAPGLDGVEMPADTLRHHGAAPAVVAERSHGRAPPLRLAGFAPQQLRRQNVMAVGEDVGLHRDRPADDAANREARRLGDDAIYHHRRAGCRGAGRVRLLAFYRIDGVELSHQHFTWLQAIGHRSSVEQTRFTQHGAGPRIERIEAHRHGLVPGQIVVDQNDKSMLRLPRIGRVEARQRRHCRRRSRQAANGLRRPAGRGRDRLPLVGSRLRRRRQILPAGTGRRSWRRRAAMHDAARRHRPAGCALLRQRR